MDEENSNPLSNRALNISSLNTNLLDEKSFTLTERTKLVVMRILVHYSCVPDVNFIIQNQKHVIESLLTDIEPSSNIQVQAVRKS